MAISLVSALLGTIPLEVIELVTGPCRIRRLRRQVVQMESHSIFGQQIKHWRKQRGLSQLRLATESGMSQRHLSFLETGRSRPGESVINRLAEALAMPLRERNELLVSAGFPKAYPEKALTDAAIAPFQQAVDQMLENHLPYPAFVINRWWDLLAANQSARAMYPVDWDAQPNGIDLFLGPGPMRDSIENFPDVAWTFLNRLRQEHRDNGPDDRMEQLLDRAQELLRDVPKPAAQDQGDLVMCPILRAGDQTIRTLSMIARFGNTREITTDELRVELIFPQDQVAAGFFQHLAANVA